MRANADRWFLPLWACFALIVVFSRQLFIGDGVRHVAHIMTHSTPVLGEARWLLFPAFLFAFIRPAVLLGLVHTTDGAIRLFGVASVVASVIYLVALRSWLIDKNFQTTRRLIALIAAAVLPSFIISATDTAEPIFAAALSVVGLAVISRTQRLPLGVLLMSLGLLLHQTVFVAFFFLPLATDWATLRDRRQVGGAAVVVALLGVFTLVVLMFTQHISLRETLVRIFLVYRNPTHMNWMRGGLLKGAAVTVAGGYAQGLVTIPGMNGMRSILSGTRHGEWHAIAQGLRLGFGTLLTLAGAIYAYRHRRWDLLVALAGLSILPIVWNNVYGYYKFYMLFPVLVALVVAVIAPRISVPVVAALALLNGSFVLAGVKDGRDKFAERMVQYGKADRNTRWITSAWEPDFPYRWPGRSCGMLMSLGKGSTAKTIDELRMERTGEFVGCLREAFCSGQPVWTDDWLAANAGAIGEIAAFHGLSKDLLDKTWWRGPEDGQVIDTDPKHLLFTFSVERAHQICQALLASSAPTR